MVPGSPKEEHNITTDGEKGERVERPINNCLIRFCMFIKQYARIPSYMKRRDLVQSHTNRILNISRWFGCLETCPTESHCVHPLGKTDNDPLFSL